MEQPQRSYVFNPKGSEPQTGIRNPGESAPQEGMLGEAVQPYPLQVRLTKVPIADPSKPLKNAGQASDEKTPLGRRNEKQQAAIDALRTGISPQLVPVYGRDNVNGHVNTTGTSLNSMFNDSHYEALNWTYKCYEVTSTAQDITGQPLFQDCIYLFNVIVAFEWEPSRYNIQMIERAAQRAGDFLFRVTAGWMAFGQVIIGGPELLNCADVQVMATNRVLPRSWVGGLHEWRKYMPLRLGRGSWQKNSRGSIPWDEPEGYRILVHEWAHYALELRDNYIDTQQIYIRDDLKATQGPYEARVGNRTVVIPAVNPPIESIMSTLEGTSQLTAHLDRDVATGKQAEWDVIIDGFKGLGGNQIPRFPRIEKAPPPTIKSSSPLHELPLVAWLDLSKKEGEDAVLPDWKDELLLPLQLVDAGVNPEHCWVYILKNLDEHRVPGRILAQGTLDVRVEGGFRLFGAEKDDWIVLIGDSPNWREKVLWGQIARITKEDDKQPGRREITELKWQDVTPKPFPIIEVLPAAVQGEDDRTARIRVNVSLPSSMAPIDGMEVYVFPQDQVDTSNPQNHHRIKLTGDESTLEGISLDGHVFVKQGEKFVIATYSQGGGPPTGSPVGGTPMTPGSSDGNLMIFFADQGEYPDGNKQHGKIRMVTTRWPGGAPSKLKKTNAEARGYTYSLCSNDLLPRDYLPTLCIFYDKRTELRDGEAIIHRQDDTGEWYPIPSYRPSGAWFVAAPLDASSAQRIIDPDISQPKERCERYRLYWVPQADQVPVSGTTSP